MDNDGIHKFAYGHWALFADLLHLAAPALAAQLDFARAEQIPASHVAPAVGPRMKQRHGDMMWRVPWRRDAGGGAPADLIVVLEFQSTVDQGMAPRMREYCGMLRGSARGAAARPDEEGPPAQLPLVVYNGSERWTAPGAIEDLQAPWWPAARLALASVQQWDYVLWSLERQLAVGGGGLAHLPLANRSAATLRLQVASTPADLLAQLHTEWVRFASAADQALRNVLHVWAGALLADMGGAESALPSVDELEGLTGPNGGKDMATVSEARLGRWFEEVRSEHVALGIEQGIERGIEQGIERGIEQGRAEGAAALRTVLRGHAAERFGASARRLDPHLDEVCSTAKLAEIGVWLMVDTIDQLIAKVEAAAADDRIH